MPEKTDDYAAAAKRLIEKALSESDPQMLRDIKTMMDCVTTLLKLLKIDDVLEAPDEPA